MAFPLKGCNKSGRISGLGGDLALGQVSIWRARLALSIKAIKSFLMVCAKWSLFSNPITCKLLGPHSSPANATGAHVFPDTKEVWPVRSQCGGNP